MNLAQSIVVGTQRVGYVEGLSTFVVGMGVVFLALTLLVIILEISGKFFASLDEKAAKKKQYEQIEVDSEVAAPTITETVETDELELIAVITAAIAASMGTSSDNLQVRSIRKTNNVWKLSGRIEQLYN